MSLLRRRLMMRQSANIRSELEVYDAGVKVAVFGNSWLVKAYDGFCVVGSYDDANGNAYPFGIGRDSNSVALQQRYAGTKYGEAFQYNGETWYSTRNCQYPMPAGHRFQSEIPLSILPCINDITGVTAYSSNAQAAKDLLDYYYGVI